MVEIQNLTKYYGSKAALKGISFTIKENEVLGFLGPNGAGILWLVSSLPPAER